jgi:outer membrane protein OmpA-like peptidoglycan-associated protein
LGSGFSFDVSGKGESEPVAPNENDDGSDNPDGRALNRRVEIRYPNE